MKRIPLTQGKFAIVDDEDYDMLMQYKWHVHKTGRNVYAVCCKYLGGGRQDQRNVSIRMHRLIMKAAKGRHIDHVNHNGLDNRKCNLRFCTMTQNLGNMISATGFSRFKGVWWRKSRKKWVARIHYRNQKFWLGSFINEIDAAKAYDKAAKQYFGEFANLNFKEKEDAYERTA